MKSLLRIPLLYCLSLLLMGCQSPYHQTSTQYIKPTLSKYETGQFRFPLDEIRKSGCFLNITTNVLKKNIYGDPDEIEVVVDVLSGDRRITIKKFSGPRYVWSVNPPLEVNRTGGNISSLQISGGDGAGVWSEPINIKTVLGACDWVLNSR